MKAAGVEQSPSRDKIDTQNLATLVMENTQMTSGSLVASALCTYKFRFETTDINIVW